MDSIFDFIFNTKKYYTLIAVDIVEGLDDNFYVVDINGLIGLRSITPHLDTFEKKLKEIFCDKEYYFDCSLLINNFDKVKIGSGNRNSNIWIENQGINFENKLSWREKFKINCPSTSDNIKINDNDDYPKYLLKPVFNFKSRGVELYNQPELIECGSEYFLEEFIPSKTKDGYSYAIRVILIIDEIEQHPIIYTIRKCENPLIKNLGRGKLTFNESLSYLSNRSEKNPDYQLYNNDKLIEFVNNLNLHL